MSRTGKLTPALPGEEGTTRTCRKCLIEKPIEHFSWYRKGESRRQTQCKECANEQGLINYRLNADRYKSVAAARRVEWRRRMNEIKSRPCTDCANRFPPHVMDFDHMDGSEKVLNLAAMMRRNFSWSTIKAEIAKCELVCANCHRMRTYRRKYGEWVPGRAEAAPGNF
jgi:hypothetical protein